MNIRFGINLELCMWLVEGLENQQESYYQIPEITISNLQATSVNKKMKFWSKKNI